jgi:hypothetical protein
MSECFLAYSNKECQVYSRTKDVGSATADWFNELLSPDAWFKDVVPNASFTLDGQ